MSRRGQGEGSIYLRSDGRWAASFPIGHGRRKSFYGATRGEVQKVLTAALRNRDQGLPTASSKRLSVYLEDWLQGVKPNLGPNSWKNDAARVHNHLIPALGSFTLAQLTPEDVEAFMRGKLTGGLSSQTVLHLRALLRRALNRALRHGLVLRNVAALSDPPKLAKTHEQQFLDVAEARAFLAAIKGDALEALWVLALTTGLRRGEQLALHWRDVDLTARTYHVTGTLQRVEGELRVLEPKTVTSRATGQLAVEALLAHRARQLAAGIHALPSAFIFTTRTGRPIEPRNVNRSFERLLKRHSLKRIRLHDLRHSIGSLMLANGESPRVVMEVLRHSQIAMTMNVYSHVMPAVTREAMDRLDALLRVPAR